VCVTTAWLGYTDDRLGIQELKFNLLVFVVVVQDTRCKPLGLCKLNFWIGSKVERTFSLRKPGRGRGRRRRRRNRGVGGRVNCGRVGETVARETCEISPLAGRSRRGHRHRRHSEIAAPGANPSRTRWKLDSVGASALCA